MQSYHHFTRYERECLEVKLKESKSYRQIAKELGRSPSTISREVKRNWSKKANHYHPVRASILYKCRRKLCVRRLRLLSDKPLREFVIKGLDKYWSPETITVKWKMKKPGQKLSWSTIYRTLRNKKLDGYTCKDHLRRHGKPRSNNYAKTFTPLHTIHDRPKEIEERARIGDLEGDTVYGAIGKGCMITLVDRKSRFLYASLVTSREKEVVSAGISKALAKNQPKSITLDNGSEFADYKIFEKNLNTTVYFADPHSPWQRGSNENINGLIRFFFIKGTDFNKVKDDELNHVLELINTRPRKCLGWLSPVEFLSKERRNSEEPALNPRHP